MCADLKAIELVRGARASAHCLPHPERPDTPAADRGASRTDRQLKYASRSPRTAQVVSLSCMQSRTRAKNGRGTRPVLVRGVRAVSRPRGR